MTQPTGQLLIDLALFSAWFVFAVIAVFIGSEIESRKGRK